MPAPRPIEDLDELGQMIRRGRDARGLKQDKAAPLLGISQTYLSDIEGGPAKPDVVLLAKLAEVLDLSLTALVHATTVRAERLKDRTAERPLARPLACPDGDSPLTVESMSLPDSSAA